MSLPQFIAPMMVSVAKEPFNHRDWIFETELDGFRAISVIDSAGKARLWSKKGLKSISKSGCASQYT